MVKIRLKRIGTTKTPFYRIVVMDERKARNAKTLAEIGTYQPLLKNEGEQIKLSEEAVRAWIAQGAQPTDIVKKLMKRVGITYAYAKGRSAAKKAERSVSA